MVMERIIESDREPGFQLQNPLVQVHHDPGHYQNNVRFDPALQVELVATDDEVDFEEQLSEDVRPLTWETLIKRTGQAVLTADQEVALAKEIESGLTARHILDHLEERPDMSACPKGDARNKNCGIYEIAVKHNITYEELTALEQKGVDARQTFILANTGLAASLARAKTKPGDPIEDKAQDSVIGVIQTLERFDYKKGYKFSTFATTAVGHVIALRQFESGVYSPFSVGVHKIEKLEAMARVYRALKLDLQREPEVHEVASLMNKTTEEVEALRLTYTQVNGKNFLQLDTPLGGDRAVANGGARPKLQDIVEDRSQPSPLEKVMEQDEIIRLHKAIDFIDDPGTKRMFELYYGFDGGESRTLKEIGEEFYLSHEAVRIRIKAAYKDVEAYFKNPAQAKTERRINDEAKRLRAQRYETRAARLRRTGYTK